MKLKALLSGTIGNIKLVFFAANSSGKVAVTFCLGLALAVILVAGLIQITAERIAPDLPEPEPALIAERRAVSPAELFVYGIKWAGDFDPPDGETLGLAEALYGEAPGDSEIVERVEAFLQQAPGSGYAPSLRSQLAAYYARTARYTRALEHWEAAWEAVGHFQAGAGKEVADQVLAPWALYAASLGKVELVHELFTLYGDRVLDGGPLSSQWLRAHEKYGRMIGQPERAFRCGVVAVDQVGLALGLEHDRDELINTPNFAHGFTLAELQELAERFGIGLQAVHRPLLDSFTVPSVVHWKQEHYAAIIDHQDGWFLIMDPTTGGRKWLLGSEIADEASGYFLIPNTVQDPGWVWLTPEEAGAVVGRSSACPPDDHLDGCPPETCCPPGRGGGGGAGGGAGGGSGPAGAGGSCIPCAGNSVSRAGMPVWKVSEPYVNLWIEDVPLHYTPSRGPAIELRLLHRQREFALSDLSEPMAQS